MKRWIVEQDCKATETDFFAIEAETREQAIAFVASGRAEPYVSKTYPGDTAEYDDTHEASPDEAQGLAFARAAP